MRVKFYQGNTRARVGKLAFGEVNLLFQKKIVLETEWVGLWDFQVKKHVLSNRVSDSLVRLFHITVP